MTEQMRILYVDDDPALLDIGRLFLEQSKDFSVTLIESAPAALSLLQKEHFDAIISDYQMPGMDGIEFLCEVRKHFGERPFILFTGKGREEVVIQAINRGVDAYIQKGGDPEAQFAELSHKIRQAVQRKRAEISIRNHERREQDLINFLPDATLAIDKKGIIIAWNRAFEEMTGIPANRMLGKGNYEYALPFYGKRKPVLIDMIFLPSEEIRNHYPNIVRDGTMLAVETTHLLLRGEIRTLWAKASPLYDQSGNVVGAIESVRDITDRKAVESALNESEERYRSVVENQTELICRFKPDGTPVFVNSAYCRYFGKTPEEIVGTTFKPDIFPDDAKKNHDHLQNLTPTHPEQKIEQRIILSGGVIRWQQWSDRAIFDEEGTIREYQSVGRDITARKASEEAIRAAEEKFATIYRQSPDMIWISELSGRFVDANDAAERIFGYTREEFIGRTSLELGIWVNPGDRATMMQMLKKKGRIDRLEVLHRRKNGEIFPVESSVSIILLGGREYILAIVRDISKIKRTEEALRESEQKYHILIDKANEAVMMVQDDRVVFANRSASRLLGMQVSRIVGKPFIDFVWSDDRKFVQGKYQKRIDGESGSDVYDFRIRNAENKPCWVLISAAPIVWQGRPATLGLMTDITDRKQMEQALRSANKKLNLLSGITRHDINNQLTVLQGYLAILETRQSDPTVRDQLQKVTIATRRIASTIQFTKEYEEIGVAAPMWQDVRELVETAAQQAPLGPVTVNNEIPAGTEVFADPLISRVFYNLMDNAARYGGKITAIRVCLEERCEWYCIICEDDGAGVPADEKEKIFSRGFGRKTGLGLFLSREILSITGITITENGIFGNGARFEIMVPPGAYRAHQDP